MGTPGFLLVREKNIKLFGGDYEYNYVFHRNLAFKFMALGCP